MADEQPDCEGLGGRIYQKYAKHLASVKGGCWDCDSELAQLQTIIAEFMYFTKTLNRSKCSALQRLLNNQCKDSGYQPSIPQRADELSQLPFAEPSTVSPLASAMYVDHQHNRINSFHVHVFRIVLFAVSRGFVGTSTCL